MFQVQQQQQQNAARAPLGANRLQNGKLGEAAPKRIAVNGSLTSVQYRSRTSVGDGRFRWPSWRRSRPARGAVTNQRHARLELCTGNGQLAAAHVPQP
jgi:hypothetical protein